jgi:hypothetical protein
MKRFLVRSAIIAAAVAWSAPTIAAADDAGTGSTGGKPAAESEALGDSADTKKTIRDGTRGTEGGGGTAGGGAGGSVDIGGPAGDAGGTSGSASGSATAGTAGSGGPVGAGARSGASDHESD